MAEALQLVDAIASIPAKLRAHETLSRSREEKLEEMRRMLEERDNRIVQLEQELKATKADLAGVCWVQAQLLDGGTL